jgi:hypothetical protein
VQGIDVCLEEGLDSAHLWIDTDRYRAEDTGHDYPVTWLGQVYELVVYAERDGMRRLTIWDNIRRLLQPNDLTIAELAAIVDKRHASLQIAHLSRAAIGFCNLTAVNLDSLGMRACKAAEEGCTERSVVAYNMMHLFNVPIFISGMIGVHRIIRPFTVTSLSISGKSRFNCQTTFVAFIRRRGRKAPTLRIKLSHVDAQVPLFLLQPDRHAANPDGFRYFIRAERSDLVDASIDTLNLAFRHSVWVCIVIFPSKVDHAAGRKHTSAKRPHRSTIEDTDSFNT